MTIAIKEECFQCGKEINGEPIRGRHMSYCSPGCRSIDEIDQEINAMETEIDSLQIKIDSLKRDMNSKLSERSCYEEGSNE